MITEAIHTGKRETEYKAFFFAGAEAGNSSYNIFTASYIRLMDQIMGEDFELMKGIHFISPAKNVFWALSNAQKPITDPVSNRFMSSAVNQIIERCASSETQIIITSSSTGSIVAAQTACYLAAMNSKGKYFSRPFHLTLGTSILSTESELFKKLTELQKEGEIGTIIYDEIQDHGDNTNGAGGTTRCEAYTNAFGLIFPLLSKKYSGPSFLNAHPVDGHLHRIRSQTVQKALDHINIILVKHKLGGDFYYEKAKSLTDTEES